MPVSRYLAIANKLKQCYTSISKREAFIQEGTTRILCALILL